MNEFKEPEKITPAAEAGWQLTFSDNFARETLGDDWKAVEGVWNIKDGALHGSGTLITTSDKLRGENGNYQRLEFTAISDVKSLFNLPGRETFTANPCDLSAFIHAVIPEDNSLPIYSGYFFQFGGKDNTWNRIAKGSANCTFTDNAKTVIEPGKAHDIVVENDHGHLKHFVDGRLIQEYKDQTPLKPAPDQNQVGFYFYTRGIIKDVKVYTKPSR